MSHHLNRPLVWYKLTQDHPSDEVSKDYVQASRYCTRAGVVEGEMIGGRTHVVDTEMSVLARNFDVSTTWLGSNAKLVPLLLSIAKPVNIQSGNQRICT